MPRFKDNKDREWAVEITTATLRVMRDLAKFQLDDVLPAEPTEADAKDKQALVDGYLAFVNDDLRFGEVLWAMVKTQADKINVSQTDFEEGLNGAANQRAIAAFHEAYTDFSSDRRQSRASVLMSFKLLMEKKDKFMELGQKRIDAEASKLDDARLESIVANALDQAGREFDSALNKLAGSSAGTSA